MASTDFKYTPDTEIQVDRERAIRLICNSFQSHEHGLPEWVKNSADEYARKGAPADKRHIVVIFDKGTKKRKPSISVLDFGGITSEAVEEHFRLWASADASNPDGAADVQGGHGNGGKCYMTMMFDDHAQIYTVADGKGCRYGVAGGSVAFGYVPDAATGRDFVVDSVKSAVMDALAEVGVKADRLPRELIDAVDSAGGFTMVTGRDPLGYGADIPVKHLVEEMLDHPQMLRSIEFASTWVLADGKPVSGASPYALNPVTPDEDFSEPTVVPIPEELIDPKTGDIVSSTDGGKSEPGQVTLRTSNVAMTHTRKARHTLIYRAVSGYIGFRPIKEMGVESSYATRIYGEADLPALEPLKQNNRQALADAPLSRAVDDFVKDQITALARRFEARDARDIKQQEKDALSKMNRALDNWKNQFLTDHLGGLGVDDGNPPPPPPLPTGVPVRIQVELQFTNAGIGVAFRPTVKFYDKNETRIRPTAFSWYSTDTNVAMVDPALKVISTYSPGKTEIFAETDDGKLRSNLVSLRVVRIREIQIEPEEIEVAAGGRMAATAICRLSSGEELRDVALVWTEDDSTVARVSATGTVFGASSGRTEVSAGDDSAMAATPLVVTVVPADEGGKNPKPGKGYPMILVSEHQPDPETGETVQFPPDDPPIQQRPQDTDRRIWWINAASPFARLYLSAEYGYKSREWRIYHIERYIDVIAQIALEINEDVKQLDLDSWLVARGMKIAEIQAEAAKGLAAFIKHGDISTLGS